MKFKKAKNKYVELVKDMPQLLVAGLEDEYTPAERSLIESKLASFSKIFCDIGCGSGGFTLEQARKDPAALFIGVDLRFKRAYRLAQKADQAEISNVLVVRGDIAKLMNKLPKDCLHGVFVNFPDPWSKRRWRKHRLLSREFFSALYPLLRTGAFLAYKTDHQEYFEETVQLIEQLEGYSVTHIERDLHHSDSNATNIESEFEKLFKYKRLPVSYLISTKNLVR